MNQRLGQYFLKNTSAVQKIVTALDLKPDESIIEIGPGSGALTFPLIEECKKTGCKLIAIEKDWVLFKKSNFPPENIKLILGDALKELPKLISENKLSGYKIVGNIPYYITGQLLRTLSELKNKPELSVLMIQKEVAERLTAKPPHNNLLASAVQFWADPKLLFTLKPEDFEPAPKVESAVIKLKTKNQAPKPKTEENYYKLIKIVFKQPRKTLLNNLKTGLKISKENLESAFTTLKLPPLARPQDLSIEQIRELATFLL